MEERARRLLEADLKERASATLYEWREYLSRESLIEAMGRALDEVSARDARGFFGHCGYRTVNQLL